MSLGSVYQQILRMTGGGKVCPAHEDERGSLSVKLQKDKILLNCHAGCDFDVVLGALGLRPMDLFDQNRRTLNMETARYRYEDEDGCHLFDVIRFEPPKTFRQQAADGNWSTKNVKKVPFQLRELLRAVEVGEQVLFLEGEKDVLRADEMGFTATTFPGGAGKWKEHYVKYFRNADVIIIPDLDLPGINGAQKIASALQKTVKRIRWLELPNLGEITEKKGKDFSDWCNLSNSNPKLLQELIDKAPDWEVDEVNKTGSNIPSWLSTSKTGDPCILPAMAANHFVDKYGSSIIYFEKTWWEWDRKIWKEVEENIIKEKIRKMLSENPISLNLTKMNIINDVYGQVRLMLFPNDDFKGFDIEKEKIIFLNGTLDLGKEEFRDEHFKDDFQTNMLEIKFNPEAKCLRWMNFLNEVELDLETQNTLQMWCGYLLVPTAKLQKSLFLIGEGSNGKGVFLMTIQNMLGRNNCSNLEMSELFDKFKVAGIRGKLVNISSELETTKVLDARFKKLVAGEPQVAEKKFQDSFEFRPYTRFLFSANEFIPTQDRSYGFFRRFDIVRFDRTFKEGERDLNLEAKIREELPGIFNWCLLGLKNLSDKNWHLEPSKKMKQVHKEFRESVNPLSSFAEERLEFSSTVKIAADVLRQNYDSWCRSHGFRSLSTVVLGKELKRLYPMIEKKRIQEGHIRRAYYLGVTLY